MLHYMTGWLKQTGLVRYSEDDLKFGPESISVPLHMKKIQALAKNTILLQVHILLAFLQSSAYAKILSCWVYLLCRGAKVLVQHLLSCYPGLKGCHKCAIMIMGATWENQ